MLLVVVVVVQQLLLVVVVLEVVLEVGVGGGRCRDARTRGQRAVGWGRPWGCTQRAVLRLDGTRAGSG